MDDPADRLLRPALRADRPGGKYVEGGTPSPLGEKASRVLLELTAPKVHVKDLAPVEFG